MHPTSLPGAFGIGDFGPTARDFIDSLLRSGQSIWQMCPLGPTGYGDSPYQCLSAYAGNTNLVSPEDLHTAGLVSKADVTAAEIPQGDVDYAAVIPCKQALLDAAWERFKRAAPAAESVRFARFVQRESAWLNDFCEFSVIKSMHDLRPWNEWAPAYRFRDPKALAALRSERVDDIQRVAFGQYVFWQQWAALRLHAALSGVAILGDMPIFVAYDSAECWARQDLFELDENGLPTAVAGVPPDYFSPTGQLWGNPLYRWPAHAAQGFEWWKDLLRSRFAMFDYLRVDHFRGFEAYWRVPYGEATAENGSWVTAPGKELFTAVRDELGTLPIIAEDLGVITPAVEQLRDHFGFPGMKVLQFAFDSGEDNDYLPHNYPRNSAVYTGTHDNDTTQGWLDTASAADLAYAGRYLGRDPQPWAFVQAALASTAQLAIVPMQDLLELGTDARMNVPGTLGGNWTWRMHPDQLGREQLERRLREASQLYGRTTAR